MEQRLSLITLGVDDFPAQKAFYSDVLGWRVEAENKDIIFYKLNGILFSLFGKQALAAGAGVSPAGSGFRALTLGIIVNTRQEVDDYYNQLQQKGVNILKSPEATPFGAYLFIFEDPESNILEIAYNPYIPLDQKGNVVTHNDISAL